MNGAIQIRRLGNIKTLTVYSTRGGNGKTIASVLIAIAANKRGIKTVLIDADVEAPSLGNLLNVGNSGPSWIDFLEERINDVNQLITDCNIPGLKVIYSPNPKIGHSFLNSKSQLWWSNALKRSVLAENELHKVGFELVIVDNQAGSSVNSLNNMILADATLMVIRPSAYGVEVSERYYNDMYKFLQGMKNRSDFYLWNQILEPSDGKEKEIMDEFLGVWDKKMQDHGLIGGGRINYNSKLDFELLKDSPDLIEHYQKVESSVNSLLDKILSNS